MNLKVLPVTRRIIIVCTMLLMTMTLQMHWQIAAAEEYPGLDAAIMGSNELYPGDDTYIQISVQNNKTIDEIDPLVEQSGLSEFYGAAVGLTLELDKGNAPVSLKTDKALLGTLPMGAAAQQLPFLLEVDDNAVSGEYHLNLVLTYRELSGVEISDAVSGQFEVTWIDRTETVELKINIRNNYETAFVITDIEGVLHSGKRSEIKVTFKNTGDNLALDSIARLSDAVAPLHLIDDTAFLGILEPGGTAVGIFEVKVDADAVEKQYSFDAEIKYSDLNSDKHISDIVKLPVDVTDNSNNISGIIGDNITVALIGAATVALVWFVSFITGRWRKRNQE